jgi:hydrogenase maturation protease
MRLRRDVMSRDAVAAERVLIGGVGYRWMRDASFGVVVSDELAQLDWPPHVEVADLGYGAILVAQDLEYAEPRYTRLILIAAIERGREPGTLHAYRWISSNPDDEEVQTRIHEAGGGVIDLDHLLIVAHYLTGLPEDVIVFEYEPADTEGGEALTSAGTRCRDQLLELVRREALRPGGSGSSFTAGNFEPLFEREGRLGCSIRLS